MTIKSKADLTTEITTNLADNTSGDISPADVRGVFTNVLDSVHSVYGGLSVADASAAQSLTTAAALLTGWTTEINGAGVTPSASSDNITVNTAGVYLVMVQLSGTGNATDTFQFHVRKDGVEVAGSGARIEQTDAADIVSCSIFFPVSCTASQVLTIYGESDQGGGANYTLVDGQFVVLRIA